MPVVGGTPAPSSPSLAGDVCAPWCTVADLPPEAQQARLPGSLSADDVCWAVSDVLFGLAGNRFPGTCERNVGAWVPPCNHLLTRWPSPGVAITAPGQWAPIGMPSFPIVTDGEISNVACCVEAERLTLPDYPVTDILSVVDSGVTLPADAYELRDRRVLVRMDGGRWPFADPGVQVGYLYGEAPPRLGFLAAVRLATEFVANLSGGSNRLPERLTNVTRQGVSAVVLDSFQFLDKGRTGLYVVDLFLARVNPKGRRWRSRVSSPDTATMVTVKP